MNDSVSFWLDGIPQPKGSWKPLRNGKLIPAGSPHARLMLEEWTHNLRAIATQRMQGEPAWIGPVRLMAEFALPVPASMPKRKFGWQPHCVKPDLDKLMRALGDALTGVVYVDDAQISNLSIAKVYAWNQRTGVNIIAERISDDTAQRIARVTNAVRDYVSS